MKIVGSIAIVAILASLSAAAQAGLVKPNPKMDKCYGMSLAGDALNEDHLTALPACAASSRSTNICIADANSGNAMSISFLSC